jgi:hypothetical protein
MSLGFADAEHFSAAFCADTLSCRFAILHFNGPGIFHFSLGPAFHAISFHQCTSFVFEIRIVYCLKLVKYIPVSGLNMILKNLQF